MSLWSMHLTHIMHLWGGGGGGGGTSLLGVTWSMFCLTPTEMFESEVVQEDFRHILLRFLLYLYFFHEKFYMVKKCGT